MPGPNGIQSLPGAFQHGILNLEGQEFVSTLDPFARADATGNIASGVLPYLNLEMMFFELAGSPERQHQLQWYR